MIFLVCASAWTVPPRSIALPEEAVEDVFIGYLFALLQRDILTVITGDELRELFPEYDDDVRTPLDFIDALERARSGPLREVRLTFDEPVAHPAPIDILGHKPVMLYSTAELTFREVHLDASADPDGPISAYVLYLEQGSLFVDFARWLDILLGSIVDDVSVKAVLAVWYDDRWYGVLAGFSPKGEIVTSVYDMPRGRFLARPPRAVTRYAAAIAETAPR
jgi:hypothetical protein